MTVLFITSCEKETDLNVDSMKKLETIIDPNAKITITTKEIKVLGQQNQPTKNYEYSTENVNIIVLDFEGLGNVDNINNFYNGGTSSQGYSGTNYGVEFGVALAVIDADAGGSGNFANEPSPSTVMFFLDANQVFMNVAAGFTTGFSFYYSSNTSNGSVSVYDGLNGTGNLLGTLNLALNYDINCIGDPNGTYCNWDPIAIPFEGTAKSVVFSGVANRIAFDDVTFGSTTPGAVDSDGDGCLDDDDEIPSSNMEATVTIDGCDSGVVNRTTQGSCGITMSDMIDGLEAGTYINHGQFVRAVANVINGWFAAGFITLEEKDAIMACAGQANIPN